MVRTLIVILISSVLTISAFAEVKTFSVTVKRIMGEHESRDELREFATLEAKRQALEQAGAYLQTETSVKNYKLESDEITVLAAGVLSTKQAKEEWAMEGGHFVIKLTYEITIETSDLDKKITALRNDTDKMKDNRRLQAEVDQLRREIAKLRDDIEEAPKSEVEVLKQDRKRLSNEVEATEWAEKAGDEENIEKKIEYYTRAIELNPEYITAYFNRAGAYCKISQDSLALYDYSKVIDGDTTMLRQISLWARGDFYFGNNEYEKAIEDYTLALEFPENLFTCEVLLKRGGAYFKSDKIDEAIRDFKEATEKESFFSGGQAYISLCACYHEKKDYRKCIEILDQALEKHRSYGEAFYRRGFYYLWIYYNESNKQTDCDKGMKDMRKAAELGNEKAIAALKTAVKKSK